MRLGGEGPPVGCSASEGSCGLSTCRWYHVSIYVRPWEEDRAGQGGLSLRVIVVRIWVSALVFHRWVQPSFRECILCARQVETFLMLS